MTSDPSRARRDGPTKDMAPGDGHSGEGLASVRPGLERTNADTALRTADRQAEHAPASVPPDPDP
ncbi:MAG: hypothetical protein JWQ33_998, partial [Ramlibacter sp.]|nr:hypothetical protein [Ramlibacter sp.]